MSNIQHNPDSLHGDFRHVLNTNTSLEKRYNNLVSDKKHYTENINKLIVLRNVGGRLNAIGRLIPTLNKANNELKGVLRLSDRDKETMDYVVTKKTVIEAKDGHTFNLGNTIDRLNWNWVQYSELIAPNRLAAQSNPQAMFYIEDNEAELELTTSAAELVYKAERMVRDEWSSVKRVDMARLLGQDMSYSPDLEVLDYLVTLARKGSAEAILKLEKDTYQRERLLLLRFIDTNVVELKGTAYYYGDTRIGLDENSALHFMLRAENRDVVDHMQMLYNSRYQPSRSQFGAIPVRGRDDEQDDSEQTQLGTQPDYTPAPEPLASPALAGAKEAVPAFGIEQFKEVAPLTYARMFSQLTPAQLAYVATSYSAETLHSLARQELMNSLGNAGPAAPAAPEPAPVPVFEEAPARPSFIASRREAAGTLQEGETAPKHPEVLVGESTASSDPYAVDDDFGDAETEEEEEAPEPRIGDYASTPRLPVPPEVAAQQLANAHIVVDPLAEDGPTESYLPEAPAIAKPAVKDLKKKAKADNVIPRPPRKKKADQ